MHNNSLILPIVHILLTGVSVLIIGKLLPGIRVKSYGSALAFAFVVAILNGLAWMFLGPLRIGFSVLTLGLGGLIVNGLLYRIADAVIEGVEISGCFTAILASIGVTAVNWVMHLFLGKWAP